MLPAHILPPGTLLRGITSLALPLPHPDMALAAMAHHPSWNDALCMRVLHFPDTAVGRCKTNKAAGPRSKGPWPARWGIGTGGEKAGTRSPRPRSQIGVCQVSGEMEDPAG